ncbi:MAG: ADP-dependent (S)-NAD(P)H-hydrate dehydratase [Microgenomates group bacterium LiPW_16]|nr:MAG: ADP-dependent (S)-NAD(P)H-hydrate dehydratase [Microgenomates group bacterium LiPW_16]
MEKVTIEDLKKLYLPPKESHKGENGKLTIIGGSKLFYGASLWALKVASRIIDMVFYASIPENNELTKKLKSEIFDFIAVPREKVEEYIRESDAVLIGPGLPREEGRAPEEETTYNLTQRLLARFPQKKWIIDAGSLTEMEPNFLNKNCLITPHKKEFETLFGVTSDVSHIQQMAKKYDCVILLKGPTDIICSPTECKISEGGNPGMTKGGTGDVLAGLAAALACKNDLFLAACAASFINKRAGEELAKKVGYYFNASDLADQIPLTMKEYVFAQFHHQ